MLSSDIRALIDQINLEHNGAFEIAQKNGRYNRKEHTANAVDALKDLLGGKSKQDQLAMVEYAQTLAIFQEYNHDLRRSVPVDDMNMLYALTLTQDEQKLVASSSPSPMSLSSSASASSGASVVMADRQPKDISGLVVGDTHSSLEASLLARIKQIADTHNNAHEENKKQSYDRQLHIKNAVDELRGLMVAKSDDIQLEMLRVASQYPIFCNANPNYSVGGEAALVPNERFAELQEEILLAQGQADEAKKQGVAAPSPSVSTGSFSTSSSSASASTSFSSSSASSASASASLSSSSASSALSRPATSSSAATVLAMFGTAGSAFTQYATKFQQKAATNLAKVSSLLTSGTAGNSVASTSTSVSAPMSPGIAMTPITAAPGSAAVTASSSSLPSAVPVFSISGNDDDLDGIFADHDAEGKSAHDDLDDLVKANRGGTSASLLSSASTASSANPGAGTRGASPLTVSTVSSSATNPGGAVRSQSPLARLSTGNATSSGSSSPRSAGPANSNSAASSQLGLHHRKNKSR